jgi:hypothetical protein
VAEEVLEAADRLGCHDAPEHSPQEAECGQVSEVGRDIQHHHQRSPRLQVVQRHLSAIANLIWCAPLLLLLLHNTGAGGDNGKDHNKSWLRFTYVFIFSRSHSLLPHP